MRHRIKKVFHLFVVSIFIGLMLGSCQCFHRRITINKILIDVPKNLANPPFDPVLMNEVVQTILAESQDFNYSPNSKGRQLRIGFFADSKNRSQNVYLYAELWTNNKEPELTDKAYASLSLNLQSDLKKQFSDATMLALTRLKEILSGSNEHRDQYLLTLDSATKGNSVDSAELLLAISVVAEHGMQQAENNLLSLLQNASSPTIQNACVIALGELRSVKAVPLIIDFSARKSSLAKKQAIEAMRKIGTRDAMEWLLVVSEGHIDPEVREHAFKAYQEIAKKLHRKTDE